jgi:hypothetical protein
MKSKITSLSKNITFFLQVILSIYDNQFGGLLLLAKIAGYKIKLM